MNEYDLQVVDNAIKIYINGVLHFFIKKDALIAIHSWIIGKIGNEGCWYCIEYTSTNGSILTEYNEPEKWKAILALLDSNSAAYANG
jgi:hypothetical protein